MKTEFKESQRFTQWWLWLLLSPLFIITLIAIIKQLILGQPFGSKPISDFGIYLLTFVTLGVIYLFLYLKLETTVNEQGIFMNYKPVLKKNCPWSDIKNVEIIDYGFVGYGFRISKHGWIYNVNGNKGLKIYLKSGKYFTIGTQKPQELEEVLKAYENYSSATA